VHHRCELHRDNKRMRGGEGKEGPLNKDRGDGVGDGSLQSFSGANLHLKTVKDRGNVLKGGEAYGVALTAGYRLTPSVGEQIGLGTAEANKTLPSEFVSALADISNSKYKAEFWLFCVQYIRPIVLQGHFPSDKYYGHFCDLIAII
jgi:hypothetical protein